MVGWWFGHTMAGWWLSFNPSQKDESIGRMTFPTEWKDIGNVPVSTSQWKDLWSVLSWNIWKGKMNKWTFERWMSCVRRCVHEKLNFIGDFECCQWYTVVGIVVGVIVVAVLISPGVLAGSLDIFGEGRCILLLSWRLFSSGSAESLRSLSSKCPSSLPKLPKNRQSTIVFKVRRTL